MSRRPISGRKVRDLEEARALLTQWRATEEPLAAWCRHHDINVCSLSSYKRWLRPPADTPPSESAPLAFVELVGLPEPPPEPARYTLRFQNGRALEFDERFSEDALRRLLPLVQTC